MSEAYFYKGLTFECDISGPLSIEGQSIPVTILEDGFGTPNYPEVKVSSLKSLAEVIIDLFPEYKKREAIRKDHIAILKTGVEGWNNWRRLNPAIRPTLYGANLSQPSLGIELNHINFSYTDLCQANLRGACLQGANFHQAGLARADLSETDLTGANFCRADLYETNFSKAQLIDSNLQGVQLAKTNFEGAQLIGCKVYGLSAWDLNLHGAEQKELIIRYRFTKEGTQYGTAKETEITVEDLQVAQFVYLLLSNPNVRTIIDTVTSKVVLILGRFSSERKEILDAIRLALRQKDLIPIIFDFAIPANRDVTETVKVLAGLARFVIADVTDATEVRAELHDIVPEFPSLPVQPLVLEGKKEFVSLSGYLSRFQTVLPTFCYQNLDHLLTNLDSAVINPAVTKQIELSHL